MKTLVLIIYLSVGLGVAVAYGERHHKDLEKDREGLLIAVALWPGLIAADTYRAVFPEDEGATHG